MCTPFLNRVWDDMSYPNSVEVVGEGGIDEMLLETMGEKYFSGRAETKVAVEQTKPEPEKIEEPKKEEVKEGEEGPQKDEEDGEKKKEEADVAADGEKGWVSVMDYFCLI